MRLADVRLSDSPRKDGHIHLFVFGLILGETRLCWRFLPEVGSGAFSRIQGSRVILSSEWSQSREQGNALKKESFTQINGKRLRYRKLNRDVHQT